MPFGVVRGVGRGTGVLDGGGDRRRGRGSFRDEFGASHCKQWGLNDALFSNYFDDLLTAALNACYSVLAFGVGRRACLGQTLALQHLFVFMTFIVQRFHLAPPSSSSSSPGAVIRDGQGPAPHSVKCLAPTALPNENFLECDWTSTINLLLDL